MSEGGESTEDCAEIKEIMFNKYLMIPIPEILDPRAIEMGHLVGSDHRHSAGDS